MSKIPVLVIAFNRPEHVKKAMEPICAYQPDRLYFACDGARDDKDEELRLVEDVRDAMLTMIDWPCETRTLFQRKNLGCAYGPYTAISWFFEHEEYGIIIEDDVIVGHDFFKLCEDLLFRYHDCDQIMEISARNHSLRSDINNSYVFSKYMQNWGWATWRRAWAKMDMTMSAVNRISLFTLIKELGFFRGTMMHYYFVKGLNEIEKLDAWDTRWYLSILDNDGLIISPGVNLAINIGIEEGTHYFSGDKDPYADLKIGKIEWPLVYNDSLEIDKKQKRYDSQDFFHVRMIGLRKKLRLY